MHGYSMSHMLLFLWSAFSSVHVQAPQKFLLQSVQNACGTVGALANNPQIWLLQIIAQREENYPYTGSLVNEAAVYF